MLQHLWNRLQKLPAADDPVDRLPVMATFISGRYSANLRGVERECGHTELLVELSDSDGALGPGILLGDRELYSLGCVLMKSMQFIEHWDAEQFAEME